MRRGRPWGRGCGRRDASPTKPAHRARRAAARLREALANARSPRDWAAWGGLLDTTNIWVTSDHGFSQHTGGVDLDALLAPFVGTLDDGAPSIVAGAGAIYVRNDDQTTVAAVAATLQAAEGVGAVFTRAASPGVNEGWVTGTLSFDLVRWDHDRSAQILYSPDWTDNVGDFGFVGTSAQGGVAGHGSSSPYDLHTPLVAIGPDLRAGVEIAVPSGNIDFAPTFLHLQGLDIPPSVQGRVLREALRDGPDPSGLAVETTEVRVENGDGTYAVTAVISSVDGHTYLDYTTVARR